MSNKQSIFSIKRALIILLLLGLLVVAYIMIFDLPGNKSTEDVNPKPDDNINTYSFVVDGVTLTIKEESTAEELYEALGNPIEDITEVLGSEADTFEGAMIRTLIYDGLTIYLFSPQEVPEAFWIMTMISENPDIYTPNGIHVGSTLAELKTAYPDVAKIADGRTDENFSAFQISDWEEFNAMQFEINEGIVKQIKVFVELP